MKFSSLKLTSMFKKEDPMKEYDWKLSSRSKQKLEGVHPDLVKVVERALVLSPVDFGVTQGLRSLEQQKRLLEAGKSQTMKSRHLTGHAVDVAAYIGNEISWKFDYYVDIAEAFRKAAKEYDVEVGWGAAWLMSLNHYDSAQKALEDYVETRKKQGRKPFIDGPHFQLSWNSYP